MKTPDPNCEKTVALTFIIPSILPEIIYKIIFNVWKTKETTWKTLLYSILMNFHSSTPKIDCKNESTISKLWENSSFDFYNTFHVAKNLQDDFQYMENEGNTMKDTVLFYFDELPLKHT